MDRFQQIYALYGTWNHTLFQEENVLDYRPGGYHPVALGDTLKNGRYRILHKVGYGRFSTVWVARDAELARWVSIKIKTAESTVKSWELHNLQTLARHTNGSLYAERLVQMLDDFTHEGPNGRHQCLVFELLGPHLVMLLTQYYEEHECLETKAILKMSKQLLQAVTVIHEAGFAHGDIRVKNLAVTCNKLSQVSEQQLLDILGLPECEKLVREDGQPLGKGVPKELVWSVRWDGWADRPDENDDDEDIRIVDFGDSFPQTVMPEGLTMPGCLQAPEMLFTGNFDYRFDLWRVGLTIFYLIFKRTPITWFKLDDLVESMIDFVGDLPTEWQAKRHELTLGDNEHRTDGDFGFGEGGKRLASKVDRVFDEKVDAPELNVLLPVIKGLTRALPSDRISACEALALIESGNAPVAEEKCDKRDTGDAPWKPSDL